MSKNANILKLQRPQPHPRKKKSLRDILAGHNHEKRIKLKYRKLQDGRFSLYFEFWKNDKHEYEFLKIYLLTDKDLSKDDKENLKLALEVRDKRELELYKNPEYFQLSDEKQKTNFIEFFRSVIKQKQKVNAESSTKPWKNTLNYLVKFTNGKIRINEVNKKFCQKFVEYLLENVTPNSANTYLARLKGALNMLVADGIILQNPANTVKIKQDEAEREFLTVEELTRLKNTPCIYTETRNAFLFTCFTGLRLSDVKKLTFAEVQDGYLRFRQKKTKGLERVKLSENALEIIEAQRAGGKTSGNVFNLITDTNTARHIKEWVQAAEINKHITWHSGRHTFATLALTYGNDLYTVSKLLGHREVKTTAIYAKLIDRKKDEAIDRLPKI